MMENHQCSQKKNSKNNKFHRHKNIEMFFKEKGTQINIRTIE